MADNDYSKNGAANANTGVQQDSSWEDHSLRGQPVSEQQVGESFTGSESDVVNIEIIKPLIDEG